MDTLDMWFDEPPKEPPRTLSSQRKYVNSGFENIVPYILCVLRELCG
jgi:hypothetical protein